MGDVRRETALMLLRSVLCPRKYDTAPPNLYHETAFPKRVDYTGNIIIGADSALTQPKVPTQSGMILWLPNRGAGSIYRMGFIPTASTCAIASTTIPPTPNGGAANFGLVFPTIYDGTEIVAATTFTFNGPLAVPYNATVSSDVISISPNLAVNFSTIRVFNGDVRLLCDTVPIGVTALNGVYSAGSFSDTRDVAQIVSAGTTYTAFDPNSLIQNSVTKKEGLKEVPTMEGVVSLVGSDIPPFYTNPNADLSDTVRGQFSQFTASSYSAYLGGINTLMPSTGGAGQGLVLCAAWITPWQISLSTTNAGTYPLNNIVVGPIDECGILDIEARLQWLGFDQNGSTTASLGYLKVEFWHYYATCSSTGALTWVVDKESQRYYSGIVGTPATSLNNASFYDRQIFRTEPRLFTTGFTTTGKYMGTLCQVEAVYTGVPVMITTIQPLTGLNAAPIFNVRARSLNERGWVGPARVLRWDNMSSGQTLKLDAIVNAQCIPSGSIAPFVQEQAMMSMEAVDLNTLPWLAAIFNGPTFLKRNWKATEYQLFLDTAFVNLDVEKLMTWIPPQAVKALGACQAAGLFGNILGALGGVVGSAIGGKTGSAIGGLGGHLVGGMADQITHNFFGASGVIGTGSTEEVLASAQFGQGAREMEARGGYFRKAKRHRQD